MPNGPRHGSGVPPRRGRPPGPQRAASHYILGAVLARSGIRENDLRAGFKGGNAALSRNIDGLVSIGWLRTKPTPHLGSRPLTLGPQAGHLIGISVGREMVRFGIYRVDGDPITWVRTPEMIFPVNTDQALDPASFGALVSNALIACRRQLTEPVYPLACGVAWPSRIALSSGEPEPLVIRQRWKNTSVKELITNALKDAGFSVPVTIVNDADAEALAETRLGVARNARTALVVKLAGGVGAAAVHEGQLLKGGHGFSGELGHMPVAVSLTDDRLRIPSRLPTSVVALSPDLRCSCHLTGHLQTMVSAAAVADRLAPGLAEELGSYLAALEQIERTIHPTIIDLVMHELGQVLGRALCGPIAMLDPNIVVLRSIFFPTSRLVAGVIEELRAASLEAADVRLGTQGVRGRWMAAQGASLVVGDEYARPRIRRAQQDWRAVPSLEPTAPLRD